MSDTPRTTKLRHWPWVVLPILVSLLFVFYRYLEGAAQGNAEPFWNIFTKEVSAAIGTVLLLGPLILLNRRFPPLGGHSARNLGIHALAVVSYSALHTTWNWGVRTGLYALFDLGNFNYGHMPTRYLMELPLDFIVYTIVAVVVLVIERSRTAKAREVHLIRLQEQLQRTHLAQLQSQLRPHFLFNSLNTVSSVMYDDVRKADGVLQALAGILRRMVASSDAAVVPLHEEVKLIEAFVEIQEARFGDRVRMRVDVDPALSDWPVPPLILQPLVENAVQHGMPDGDGTLQVTVRGRSGDDRLRLDVSDNGPGLGPSPERAKKTEASGSGVGLSTTKERMETQYGDDGSFALGTSSEGGLQVTLEIPWTPSAH